MAQASAPVANLECEAGARTHGVLYQLQLADLDNLDHTEGVHMGFYRHLAVDVRTAEGDSITAVTYQSSMIAAGRKPSARYLGLLLDGARHPALPAEYLEYLQRFELAMDERERA